MANFGLKDTSRLDRLQAFATELQAMTHRNKLAELQIASERSNRMAASEVLGSYLSETAPVTTPGDVTQLEETVYTGNESEVIPNWFDNSREDAAFLLPEAMQSEITGPPNTREVSSEVERSAFRRAGIGLLSQQTNESMGTFDLLSKIRDRGATNVTPAELALRAGGGDTEAEAGLRLYGEVMHPEKDDATTQIIPSFDINGDPNYATVTFDKSSGEIIKGPSPLGKRSESDAGSGQTLKQKNLIKYRDTYIDSVEALAELGKMEIPQEDLKEIIKIQKTENFKTAVGSPDIANVMLQRMMQTGGSHNEVRLFSLAIRLYKAKVGVSASLDKLRAEGYELDDNNKIVPIDKATTRESKSKDASSGIAKKYKLIPE
jgi:hypothetical protein